jgi:hypothetical protein
LPEILPNHLGGFPGSGEGRYSHKLSYEDWFDTARLFRSKQELVEFYPTFVGIIAFSGFFAAVNAIKMGFAGLVILLAGVAL